MEAERAVAELIPAAGARVILRTGGAWYAPSTLEQVGDTPGLDLPGGLRDDAKHRCGWGRACLSRLRPARFALLIEGDPITIEASESLGVFCKFFALALQTCERQRIAVQNLDEVQALQRVATRMPQEPRPERDPAAHHAGGQQLLSADICGVLLRQDDRIVMRRCVGNRSPETANLQMGPGQGLAGLCPSTPQASFGRGPCHQRSHQPRLLPPSRGRARLLGVGGPLLGRDDIIGVLEVWRRRPSTFTPQDTTRLTALAEPDVDRPRERGALRRATPHGRGVGAGA